MLGGSGANRNLTIIPAANQSGTATITVTVSDGTATASDTFVLTVTAVNDTPVLAMIGAQSVAEGNVLSFTISAVDMDLPTHTLTYSAMGLPAGASFDPATQQFNWTPSEGQGPASYEVTFAVSDGIASDSELVIISVSEVNVAPVLAMIGAQSVAKCSLLSFTVSATDADLPANTLTYSATGLPAGASFDPATQQFRWTPSEAQGPGSYEVTVTVTDDGSAPLSDVETFTIVVLGPTWQNPRHPCDITDDGTITPVDVLIPINDINSHGSRDLTAALPSTPAVPPFLDPSGDGRLSPVDVLIVINYINTHGSGPIPGTLSGSGVTGEDALAGEGEAGSVPEWEPLVTTPGTVAVQKNDAFHGPVGSRVDGLRPTGPESGQTNAPGSTGSALDLAELRDMFWRDTQRRTEASELTVQMVPRWDEAEDVVSLIAFAVEAVENLRVER